MVALASTRLDMCQIPLQTAEMNPSHYFIKLKGIFVQDGRRGAGRDRRHNHATVVWRIRAEGDHRIITVQ